MSSLSTLPKGDSAWLLRKSIQRIMQQVSVLETNIGSSTTGNSANTQIIFNDNGTLRGDSGLTYNPATDLLSSVNQSLSGNLTVRTNKMAVTSTGTGFGTATPGAGFIADFLGDVRLTGAQTLIGNQSITGDSTINGSLTVTGAITSASANSAIRAAASDYAAVNFDGATASTRIAAPCQAIGTGDFSMWSRFRVPAISGAQNFAVIGLSSANNTISVANGFRTIVDNLGAFFVQLYGATTSDIRTATISGFVTSYVGQVVDVVVTRSGSTLKIYINGADTAYTETTAGTPPAWSATVASNFALVGAAGGSGATVFSGPIFRAVVYNRALSAADVVEVGTTGVNPADQWGTQTQIVGYNPAVLNGGFETNSLNASGTWSVVVPSGTGTGTIDTSGSFSLTGTNAGKLTLDASANNVFFSSNNGSLSTLVVGKRYRISIWGRKGAISGNCGFQFGNGAASAAYGSSGLTLTTAYSQSLVEIVAVTDGSFVIARQAGSAALAEIYIDDVEVTRIGAIVDLDFTVGAGYQATDRSTNNLHGTLFNGVSFTDTKKVAVLYATTNTNGNQQMLGTLAIPTNAVIEDIIVNSTGSATVSVGNASAGTQIVNGASVVSGRQKLTLATPFSTTGNLWVNSNTTDTLQFTILYTVAS
jgi:hypothetical protein